MERNNTFIEKHTPLRHSLKDSIKNSASTEQVKKYNCQQDIWEHKKSNNNLAAYDQAYSHTDKITT